MHDALRDHLGKDAPTQRRRIFARSRNDSGSALLRPRSVDAATPVGEFIDRLAELKIPVARYSSDELLRGIAEFG